MGSSFYVVSRWPAFALDANDFRQVMRKFYHGRRTG